MTDTQWPTFEVFQQEREGQPHRNVGSVHAPDAEMALLNARDVFVRRPNCRSLWVVPAAAILSKTAAELEQEPDPAPVSASGEPELYCVFQKQSQRPSDTFVTFVGIVQAASPEQALQRARQTYSAGQGWVWWVCPARAVTRTGPDDGDSMFAPALDKHYRHPYHYHTVAQMRKIKAEQTRKS